MEKNLHGLSPETRRQYMQLAGRFEEFTWDLWEEGRPGYQELTAAIKLWFAELGLTSPATIATYRSALARYSSALGYEIDLARVVPSAARSRANTRKIEPVDDVELGRIRREASEAPPVRAAVELALAGLTLQEIVAVQPQDLTRRGLQIAMVVVGVEERPVEIFDPVSVRFLVENKEQLPIENHLSLERLRQRVGRLLWRNARKRGGVRCLKLTGIRRAIAMGISRKRIADSLQQEPSRSWEEFRRHKSKRPANAYDPVPADPARARSISEMSEQEFERYLEGLGLDDPE